MKLSKLKTDSICCHPITRLPQDIDDNKINVFLGIGLWSKVHGLSLGLPIDVLLMLITADRLRNQMDSGAGNIYLLIADSLAMESISDCPGTTLGDVLIRRDQTIQIIKQVCNTLKIKRVIIEFSSIIAKDEGYQKTEGIILSNEKYKNLVQKDKELGSTTQNYILKQTALVAFYSSMRNCGLKISWCHDARTINNGVNSETRDEPWFDAYYRQICGDSMPIGFVYTHSGMQLNKERSTTCVPYCAANKEDTRLLFGDTLEQIKTKLPVDDKGKYALSKNMRSAMLVLIYELNGYLEMGSGKNESNVITIIEDLAKITTLGAIAQDFEKQTGLITEKKPVSRRSKSLDFGLWSTRRLENKNSPDAISSVTAERIKWTN